MRKIAFALMLLLLCRGASAQETRIGYVNGDSLMLLMPGYAAQMDTIYHFRMKIDTALSFMEIDLNKKIAELDSMRHQYSALIIALKEHDIKQQRENITEFRESMRIELAEETARRTRPYRDKLITACKAVGTRYNCQMVFDTGLPLLYWSAATVQVFDLTEKVAVELGFGKR